MPFFVFVECLEIIGTKFLICEGSEIENLISLDAFLVLVSVIWKEMCLIALDCSAIPEDFYLSSFFDVIKLMKRIEIKWIKLQM